MLAILQAACGVDQQEIRALGTRAGEGVKGQRGGIRALGGGQHRHAGAAAPDLQLFYGGGAAVPTPGFHAGIDKGNISTFDDIAIVASTLSITNSSSNTLSS